MKNKDRNNIGKIIVVILVILVAGLGVAKYFSHSNNQKIRDNVAKYQPFYTASLSENEINQIDDYYDLNENKVIYKMNTTSYPLENADAETFVKLAGGWGIDKNAIYKGGQRYVFPTNPLTTIKFYKDNFTFVANDTNVFALLGEAEIVSGANIDTFTPFTGINGEGMYGRDDSNIYYTNTMLTGVDYTSFVSLGMEYAKDKNNIYYKSAILTGVDYDTFSIGKDGRSQREAKDKNGVIVNGNR